ncbi:MAG: hypothetical protein EON92_18775 [Burkholderiales bacterium]|nr:MAG: hypothetical protein EON92_18775 [Burkholderiales bacterium]
MASMFHVLAPLTPLTSVHGTERSSETVDRPSAKPLAKAAGKKPDHQQARPAPAATPGLVSRVRSRLFPAKAVAREEALAPEGQKRGIGFQASIAELLLVNRLKALGRRHHAVEAEIMERASHVVFVTCQNWFTEPEAQALQARQTRTSPHRTRL